MSKDTQQRKGPVSHFVKVERRLEGGKKGYVIYWSDGSKWYRHGIEGHTPRVLRSTNRTIGILERKVTKFFPKAKIECRSNRSGDLSEELGRLEVPVKPLPFTIIKDETAGQLRKENHWFEARIKNLERQIKILTVQNQGYQHAITQDMGPEPISSRGSQFSSGAVQEYSNDRLGVALNDRTEIVLTRLQWQELIENREVAFDALHAYSAEKFPMPSAHPRLPSDTETR